MNITDPLEKSLALAFDDAGVEYVHESEQGNHNNGIDFYLPKYGVYVEVKQYHSDRVSEQLKRHEEVIVIQGKASVNYFALLVKNNPDL
jgi:hypothetical protein